MIFFRFWKSILVLLTTEGMAMSGLDSLSQTKNKFTPGISRREILMGIGAAATQGTKLALISTWIFFNNGYSEF